MLMRATVINLLEARGSSTAKDLSEALDLDLPTMTGLLDQMVTLGILSEKNGVYEL